MLRRTFVTSAAPALLLAAGCSKPAPRAANPTKPVPERRAVELIARAIRSEKLTPLEGRDVTLASNAKLHVDVFVDKHKWGIAYLTLNDSESEDGQPAPKKDSKRPNALVVVDAVGKNDAGTKILVLFEKDYLYDDQAGEEHEQTMITAEGAIQRDVVDFIVQAKAQGWE